MPDAHKNFAYSTVATAPSPATTGTSLVVAAGEGTKFPAVPFNATIWPAGVQPLETGNTTTRAEIVRVTAISTDTLTIVRQTESSGQRTIVVGDQIAATITNQTMLDAEYTFKERATQVVAAGTTITVTDNVPITPFTTSGNVTNTAAPFIAAGRDGQLVILRNDNGTGTLTLSDTNIGAGGSLLRLSANTVTMAAGSTMGLKYSTTQSAWVELWYLALVAVTPTINTFTVDGQSSALTHEWGDGSTANDTAPALVAAYTGVPSAADAYLDGSPANAFSTPFTSLTGAAYYRSATRNGTRAFVLHATVNGSALTSGTVTVTYRAPNYSGVSTQTTNLTSAQVVALTHTLDTDPYGTYSSIPATGASDYIWFGFVSGDATLDTNLFFAIGGERMKCTLKDNPVSVTSTYGKVQNYQTYRSDIIQLGTVSVVVQSTRPPSRRYIGKQSGTSLTEAQVEALVQSDLTESANGTWTAIASIGASDRLWLALPSVISAPAHFGIKQNSASGYEEATFTTASTVSVTNAYGFVDAAVKLFYSITGLDSININGATTGLWSLSTQAAAFNRRIFMGPHADSAITSAHILTLDDGVTTGSSVVASTVAGTYAVNISGSDYLWFCHPSTVSDLATIKDVSTGFAIAGSYRTNVTSHTSDTGETGLTMRVWRSDNVGIFPSGGSVIVT